MPKIIRTKEIKIRLTDGEHRRLTELSCGKALAPWIRNLALGERELNFSETPKADPDLLRHLSAIGNNVNQIARAMNNQSFDASQKIVFLYELEQIETHLRSLC